MSNTYATLAELQAHIDASGDVSWQAADVGNMNTALAAATRWIDERMDTRFRAVAESRVYTARWPDLLYIDDLVSLTMLSTDEDGDGAYETTWFDSDFILEPANAAMRNRPYRQIRRRANGGRTFPTGDSAIEVTGMFGYSLEPPAPIHQACLLLAHRLWMRKDAIFGVAGTPGLGVTIVQARINADADVLAMLDGVDRRYV